MNLRGPYCVDELNLQVVEDFEGTDVACGLGATSTIRQENAKRIARALNELDAIRALALGDVDVRIVGGRDAKKLHTLIYPPAAMADLSERERDLERKGKRR